MICILQCIVIAVKDTPRQAPDVVTVDLVLVQRYSPADFCIQNNCDLCGLDTDELSCNFCGITFCESCQLKGYRYPVSCACTAPTEYRDRGAF